MVKQMAPLRSSVFGHLLEVPLLVAGNENDSLPWLRTQNKGVTQGC